MFDQCTVEALHIRWRKRDIGKAGIAITGLLLLLMLMMWVPVASASTSARTAGLARAGSVQAAPTVDVTATMTALNEEKLQHENDWWWSYGALILASVISALILALTGMFAVVRYFNDRRDEREKFAEERFQKAVGGLGEEQESARVVAAIMLRTFLQPGYKQFYRQIFDLAVANLHLFASDIASTLRPGVNSGPASLNQALITLFRESFPLARNNLDQKTSGFNALSLDASYIVLIAANIAGADLKGIWMPNAQLIRVNLSGANLSEANLSEANLSRTNIEDALSLQDTNLRGVKGLDNKQKEACKAKGAIIDEDYTISSPQSTVVPPPPTQNGSPGF
jgi:Pentapeptide repeats (8 copies)